ncbi:MAG TPA: GDSL-type esterase/lipase family protein [Mucilaginibacter sp.]|nr:GDSL-type esterase/lipase family protein [Mucilaginibacter sp.]
MKYFLFFLALTVFYDCTRTALKPVVNYYPGRPVKAPAVLPGDTVSYLALGDSYTYGVGVQPDQSYPFQLAALLRDSGYLIKDPTVIAFQGWTVNDLLTAIMAKNPGKKFDFVTILIGANDENKHTDLNLYTTRLDNLITQAITYAAGYGNRVFVISIPDWSVTPFANGMDKAQIRDDVARFNTINQFESTRLGAHYIDITALSEQLAADPTMSVSDGLHPSAKAHALWAKQIQANVMASFK